MRCISIIFLASLGFFLAAGCKKDPPAPGSSPEPETLRIPKEVYDYSYFLPGTYWVYQDSATGALDSVYVYAANRGVDTIFTDDGEIDKFYEWFQCKAHSGLDGYNYYYWTNGTWSANNRIVVFKTKTKPGDYVGEIILMENPPITGNVSYWYNDNVITVTNNYSAYTILGEAFPNVVEVNDSKDITEQLQEVNYYLSRHFGVIRKELVTSGKVWNLARYNIIQ